jgi:DNA (cytosine-5)-methyltransferase 1
VTARSQPTLLDAYCGAGGATRGYQRAGFHVIGVDTAPQPHYCGDEFYQADAITFIRAYGHGFGAIHTSPPCQAYTLCQRIRNQAHADLVADTRDALIAAGRPWVIENVEGSPLRDPVTLCGQTFPGLRVYRHRLFETSFTLPPRPSCKPHRYPLCKMGRPPRPGEFMHVVGNFSGAAQAREAMGIAWMTRDELRESIPPAYTEYVGRYLMAAVADTTDRQAVAP